MKIVEPKDKNSGQALLIGLLVVAVALTVGLSIISRSITDIRISQQEEESARVFSVAEAGIEASLKAGEATSVTIGEIEASVEPSTMGGSSEFVFPTEVVEGESQTIWLMGHAPDGELNPVDPYGGSQLGFYWGNQGKNSNEDDTPALEVAVFYQDVSGEYLVQRGAFDPNSSRTSLNGFEIAQTSGCQNGGTTYAFCKTSYALPAGTLYAVRMKLIYNSDEAHLLGISGNGNFPSQGTCFVSTATNTVSGITRKVEHCQFYPSLAGIFDYALFSEGNLVK
jgi:hypothetical protein